MKTITMEDVNELYKKLKTYTSKAEDFQYPMLFMIDLLMVKTMNKYIEEGGIKDQSEANAMFRVVLKVIGEDFSDYEEINVV